MTQPNQFQAPDERGPHEQARQYEQAQQQEPDGGRPEPAPEPDEGTGVPEIDRAMAGLDDLAGQPVAAHHDRLSRAHEALHTALHQPADSADPSA